MAFGFQYMDQGSYIYANTAADGDGGLALIVATAMMNYTEVFENTATHNIGGGVRCGASTFTMPNASFWANVAEDGDGGGLCLMGAGGDSEMVDSTFTENYASGRGGGFSLAKPIWM